MAKKNIIGVDNLIESAFVPEAGTQAKREEKMQNALRQEANSRPTLSLNDLLAGVKVSYKHAGTPEDGLHVVRIDGEPEVKTGKNGPYIEVELEEVKTGLCWKTYINGQELGKKLEEINFFNNGMLAGKTGIAAINFLQKQEFNVWTIQTEKKTTATYFNKELFDKRVYAASLSKEKKEEAEQKKKEREDREARLQEEAELTKKAKQEQEKAPWKE